MHKDKIYNSDFDYEIQEIFSLMTIGEVEVLKFTTFCYLGSIVQRNGEIEKWCR